MSVGSQPNKNKRIKQQGQAPLQNMTTIFYSILHFLVDSICAAAMFSSMLSGTGGHWRLLVYNFCAFVLQMSFGALLDTWNSNAGTITEASKSCQNSDTGTPGHYKAFLFALAGVIFTAIGAFTSPVILGIGNALFHVGGGVGTIIEDRACGSDGQRLGIFVAPGAMGLFLGRLAAQSSIGRSALSAGMIWVSGSALLAAVLLIALRRMLTGFSISEEQPADMADLSFHPYDILIIAGCFLVVVIRSYVGLAVNMPWRTTVAAGLVATTAVVLGKMIGGFSAAAFGNKRTVLWSLIIASVCYALCDRPVWGISALFFFNMTMPVTLQILVDRYQKIPGTMFGFLTVGLFLGYLPFFFSLEAAVSGKTAASVLSVLSMIILSASAAISENHFHSMKRDEKMVGLEKE